MATPFDPEHPDWVWVPVTEIMATIEDSADMSFLLDCGSALYRRYEAGEIDDDFRTDFLTRMIRAKSSDHCFGSLVESILEHGWTSAIAWNPELGYLGNGHHRFVAAILLCEEYVPTTPRGSIWSKSQGELGWDEESEYDEDQIVSWAEVLPPNSLLVEV